MDTTPPPSPGAIERRTSSLTLPLDARQHPPAARSQLNNRSNLVREIACHSTLIIAGWSDASSGPLIPYIQKYYGISYTIVSMLFVGQMVGFLSAGFSNGHLTHKYGLGKVITLGAAVQALGYIFLIPAFPFAVMPCCYAVIGFGMALQDAAANTFVATLPNAEHKFGLLHASYGIGALVCPLAATAFASHGIKFSYFYSISLGLAGLNLLTLIYAFRFDYRVEVVEEERSPAEMELKELEGGDTVATTTSEVQPVAERKKDRGMLYQTLSNRTMWIFSVFILVYVGAEVSMGGWIVTFVIDERHGGPSAGYVATGFWAGITLGRAALPHFNVLVGERRVVFFYLLVGGSLEFAIWFSDNLIGNAVAVALIGVLMGPLYPIVMSLATKLLPRHLHSSAIGFIAAFGQTGSAIFPFTTGALAQKYNTGALQPVMVALFVVMGFIWTWSPRLARREE